MQALARPAKPFYRLTRPVRTEQAARADPLPLETDIMSSLPQLPRRIADLRRDRAEPFEAVPDAEAMTAIATDLNIDGLRKLRFKGTLDMLSEDELRLDAHLGATVIQPCVVTLAPVTTRIEADVTRRFLRDLPEPQGDEEEVEMPEDDTLEPLTPVIDLAQVMIEALALNLPLYPRADGADLGEAVFAAPGVTPMRDEDARPFAGLAGLRETLQDTPDDEENQGD
jgi:uncharacterized metal-binding protein YceD (DUF177 family)